MRNIEYVKSDSERKKKLQKTRVVKTHKHRKASDRRIHEHKKRIFEKGTREHEKIRKRDPWRWKKRFGKITHGHDKNN